jgi:hypothetical protein
VVAISVLLFSIRRYPGAHRPDFREFSAPARPAGPTLSLLDPGALTGRAVLIQRRRRRGGTLPAPPLPAVRLRQR